MYFIYRLSWKPAILCGVAFGMGFFIGLLYWIGEFGYLPWIALAIFQMIFILCFTVSAKLIGQRLGLWGRFILLPSLWVLFEYIRSLGMFGFTWGDLGYSQYKVLPIIRYASYAGVWGVSFLLAMSNSALANLWFAWKDKSSRRTAIRQVALVIIIAVMSLPIRVLTMSAYRDIPVLKAAVVQGNINQDIEESVEFFDNSWSTYRALTRKAGDLGAQLIVWPETVVPGVAGRDLYAQEQLKSLADAANANLLVGGWDEDGRGKVFNSAFLIDPNHGIVGKYAKVHLVPFGEFIPAKQLMPFLKYYRVKTFDISPGTGYNLIDLGSHKIGTAICFESTFPYISRRLAASGAEVLCVITNDCWFDRTAAAEEHMAMSVLRAVENHRYVLRAASTGTSVIIDPEGHIMSRVGLCRAGLLVEDIRLHTDKTFYTRHGDWLVGASAILAAFLSGVSLRRKQHGHH